MECPLHSFDSLPSQPVGSVNRKLSAQIPKHAQTLNCLATRPQVEFLHAGSLQIFPTNRDRALQNTDGQCSNTSKKFTRAKSGRRFVARRAKPIVRSAKV